ncbi:MAG TPA: alpha/beta hydrolase [Anaeromyxobacter sp.]
MVLAGQFLERPALVDAGGFVLEALYHRGARRPALLVCPPTGGGAGMDSAAVAELAWAAARAGLPSLRFQHRGVGASQGEADPRRAVDDAAAALAHLGETAGRRIAIAGVGDGAATALALARLHPEVDRIALVSPAEPPVGPLPVARVLVVLPEDRAAEASALVAPLGERGAVEIVAGADALFRAGLPGLGRAVVAFVTGRG